MMTQSKSHYRSALKLAALTPLIFAISLLPACESAMSEYSEQEQAMDEVSITISDLNVIIVNGTEMTAEELDRYLEANADVIELINFEISPDAQFGIVTDIQKVLRNHGAMRINHYLSSDRHRSELERVTNEYLEAAESYMNIKPDPYSSYDQLKEKFEEITELYESIKVAMADKPDAPPPPPMVPSPEERMMETVSGIQIEERNLMQILLNHQGLMLVNDEPAELYEVKERVKKFVDNNGADPRLSESPAEAIVAVRTAPDTSYEIYIQLLDEIMLAYNELRDEAAQARFGAPYASFDENSGIRKEIREMYPARISVKEPEQL